MSDQDPSDIILGHVTFPVSPGQDMTVALRADGRWVAPDPEWAEHLNLLYRLSDYGPAHGRTGALLLHQVAQVLGGTATMPEITDPPPPGEIY